MLGAFILLYPGFMNYMGSTFKSMMPLYAGIFLGESFLLILYYYSWDWLASKAGKWLHMAIGVVANGMGVVLLLLANGWASFIDGSFGGRRRWTILGKRLASLAFSSLESLERSPVFGGHYVGRGCGGRLCGLSISKCSDPKKNDRILIG